MDQLVRSALLGVEARATSHEAAQVTGHKLLSGLKWLEGGLAGLRCPLGCLSLSGLVLVGAGWCVVWPWHRAYCVCGFARVEDFFLSWRTHAHSAAFHSASSATAGRANAPLNPPGRRQVYEGSPVRSSSSNGAGAARRGQVNHAQLATRTSRPALAASGSSLTTGRAGRRSAAPLRHIRSPHLFLAAPQGQLP
jgi:hypothetical protein